MTTNATLKLIKKNKTTQPWLNDDGSEKDGKQIEELGRNWSARTWDEYLKSTEEIELREQLFPEPQHIENFSSHECIEFFHSIYNLACYPDLQFAINYCLDLLPPKQKKIVLLSYWDKKSQYDIAKELGITRSTVQRQLRIARDKLKEKLTNKKLQQYIHSLSELKQEILPLKLCA